VCICNPVGHQVDTISSSVRFRLPSCFLLSLFPAPLPHGYFLALLSSSTVDLLVISPVRIALEVTFVSLSCALPLLCNSTSRTESLPWPFLSAH
jgi:hypothetical protein